MGKGGDEWGSHCTRARSSSWPPASLPSLYIAGCPTFGTRRGVLALSFPHPQARTEGGPLKAASLSCPPTQDGGEGLASPLRGQRSRLRPAGCRMMESLRPNLPGDAGWVSCGARILALVRSGPAWDTGRWDPLSSRGRPWNGHLACFLPDANQGYD